MPDGYHEDHALLRPETLERHRALRSVIEELEAVDWYDQRVDASKDDELRAVLAHNRDEEKEHAAMSLEWLRRNDAVLDRYLREHLFSEGSIAAKDDHAAPQPAPAPDGGLGIGGLRGRSA
jgi:uncharacterized protein